MPMDERLASRSRMQNQCSTPVAFRGAWWGPLDGPRAAEPLVGGLGNAPPRPDASDVGGPDGDDFGSPGALRAAGVSSPHGRLAVENDKTPETDLHRQLDNVRLAIADRNRQIAALTSGDAPGSEAAALRADIRKAIADKQSLQEDMVRQANEMQALDEAFRRPDARVQELEACLGFQSADKFGESTSRYGTSALPVVGPSSDASFLSTEDAALDGASCWRECVAALEGEIRRKSQLALELHHRVHTLENQLHQQLQATDDRVETMHSSLRYVLDQLLAYAPERSGQLASGDQRKC